MVRKAKPLPKPAPAPKRKAPKHGKGKPSGKPKPVPAPKRKPKHGNAEGSKTTKRPPGRPLGFTPEIGAAICKMIAVQGMSLREVCRQPGMPDRSTIYDWRHYDSDECRQFAAHYARAREEGWENMAEELLEIADDGRNDWVDRNVGDTTIRVVDEECVRRSVLRVDTRKWVLSKRRPQTFGEATLLKLADNKGTGPVTVMHGHFDRPAKLDGSDAERDEGGSKKGREDDHSEDDI